MNWLDLILIAIGLSMDAAAVCIGAAASGMISGKRATFRLAFHFGLFQFLMPVIGWFLGVSVAPYISAFDHWIAVALLSFVGGRMVLSGLAEEDEKENFKKDPSRGLTLVMLSIATSIDALAVGLSFAMLRTPILTASITIGVITGALSFFGVQLGRKLGTKFGERMEIVGGVVLIAIGLRILFSHMVA